MEMTSRINCKAELSAVLIRADGSRKVLGVISKRDLTTWWKRLLDRLRHDDRGIVTNAGVNYMASDFASGGSSPTISGFKYHDAGTGTGGAAVTDTALGIPWGGARVSGTASNPTSNQYRSVATISFTGTFAITEWGLFSAATAGTLWDRRVFNAINVVSGDSVQFSYTLSINSGGT